MEQLGLLMVEPRQRGGRLSMARTRVPWGDMGGGGEQSLCTGSSSWSPFLLLTQCLLRTAFGVESNRAVLGSG